MKVFFILTELAIMLFFSVDYLAATSECQESLQKLGCRCKSNQIDCSYTNISEIPRGIPRETVSLKLSHNRIESIGYDDLCGAGLNAIMTLDLSWNHLQYIENSTFECLKTLESLYLIHNELEFSDDDPTGIVSNIASVGNSLRTLDIRSNAPLADIYPKTLWIKLQNLKTLFMDGVQSQFSDNFLPLTSLESLSFIEAPCAIPKIKADHFIGLRNSPLTKLDLNDCHIKEFDGGSFKYLHKLSWLSVAKNQLRSEVVKMASGLKSLPLAHLDLNQTDIRDNIVSLLYGPLCNITTLKYLTLADNHLYTLGILMTVCFQSLEVFSVGNNTFFEHTIDTLDMFGMRNLRLLNISNQYLEEPRGVIPSTNVSGSSSGIHICEKGQNCSFSPPPYLELVDLSNGGIWFHMMPALAILTKTNLKYMLLVKTGITSLEGPCYCHDHKMILDELDMTNNDVQKFPQDYFKYCDWALLRRLSVYGNREINLVLNEQKTQPFFSYLSGLEELNLGACGIKKLHKDVFKTNINLVKVSLSDNHIQSFEVNIGSLLYLRYLDLSNNSISYFTAKTIKIFNNVQLHTNFTINLQGNPLRCSCGETLESLTWMYRNKGLFTNINSYECIYPDGSQGFFARLDYILQRLDGECMGSWLWLILPYSISMAAIILTTCLSCLYRWRYTIDLKRFRNHSTADVSPEGDQGGFIYDAFVGFNTRDLDWVEKELCRNIEEDGRGMRPLTIEEQRTPVQQDSHHCRLAVHHRDFTPGGHITMNIFDALRQSRTTLMVVSNAALRGEWWQFELRFALENAASRRNDSIIFLFLEPVEATLVTPELRRILNVYTCERWWPNDPIKQENLWLKLKSAIKYPTKNGLARGK